MTKYDKNMLNIWQTYVKNMSKNDTNKRIIIWQKYDKKGKIW